MVATVLPGPEIFFRPVLEKSSAKSGKSSANLHIKRKTAFSRRVNKIVNKFFSLSLSVCHFSKRKKFFQNISRPLFCHFWWNSAINSSGQIFFSPAPFELFARNFGHLATLGSKTIIAPERKVFIVISDDNSIMINIQKTRFLDFLQL